MTDNSRFAPPGTAPQPGHPFHSLDEHEPTVVDLVANLRARCDAESIWLRPRDLDGPMDHVMLPVDLVLAIADGIEATSTATLFTVRSPGGAPTEEILIMEQLARDIVKLFVTKLFAPAKEEAEKALEACETLGLSEEETRAVVMPSTLPIWAAGLAAVGALPLIWSFLRTRARGASTVTK